jgi:ferritin-like metal-binding protein YciE
VGAFRSTALRTYGTGCADADVLGESGQAALLRQTLEEEKETNEKLTELSTQINQGAEQEPPEGQMETKR